MSLSRRPARLTGDLALILYAGGLLTWCLLRPRATSLAWPFELLAIGNPWLYLPVPLLIVAGLIVRSRRTLAAATLLTALFLWEYGALFTTRPAPAGGLPVRIITANLLVNNPDVDGFIALVERERPDIIAVQELSARKATSLASQLVERYPYQSLQPQSVDSWKGAGILSRTPVQARQLEVAADSCACIDATVELQDRAVRIINVHPGPPRFQRIQVGGLSLPHLENTRTQAAFREIRDRVDQTAGPVLVLGDLNTSDRQPAYGLLTSSLRDAHLERGWGFGFTFPTRAGDLWTLYLGLPMVRIDYILHDQGWDTRAVWTGEVPGSDHRYVAADLILR